MTTHVSQSVRPQADGARGPRGAFDENGRRVPVPEKSPEETVRSMRVLARRLWWTAVLVLPVGSVIPWPSFGLKMGVLLAYVAVLLTAGILWERRTGQRLSDALQDSWVGRFHGVIFVAPFVFLNTVMDSWVPASQHTLPLGLLWSVVAAAPLWGGALWVRWRAARLERRGR